MTMSVCALFVTFQPGGIPADAVLSGAVYGVSATACALTFRLKPEEAVPGRDALRLLRM
jgi:hypothetical protein